MKKIIIFSLLTACFFSNCSNNNRPFLKTGFYFVTNNKQGIKINLKQSKKKYYLDSTLMVSGNNVSFAKLNYKDYFSDKKAELTLRFDSVGAINLNNGLKKLNRGQIGLIINNDLVTVVSIVEDTQISKDLIILLSNFSEEELESYLKNLNSKGEHN